MSEHIIDYSLLNKDSLVIDAGAGSGEFMDELREHIHCPVISIEPNKSNIHRIKKKNYKDHTLVEGILVGKKESDTMPFTEFYRKDRVYSQWGAVTGTVPEKQRRKVVKGGKKCEIIFYPVKAYLLEEISGPVIDLLKMDIEGYEQEVVNYLSESAFVIKQIEMEVHNGCDWKYITETLSDMGYRVEYHETNDVITGVRKYEKTGMQ